MWIVGVDECRYLWKGLQCKQKLGTVAWSSPRREDKESVSGAGAVWQQPVASAPEEPERCQRWGCQLRMGLRQHAFWRRDSQQSGEVFVGIFRKVPLVIRVLLWGLSWEVALLPAQSWELLYWFINERWKGQAGKSLTRKAAYVWLSRAGLWLVIEG